MSVLYTYDEEERIECVQIAQRRHKARVSHLCDDCQEVINPGAVYTRTLWILDGSFYSQATHTSYRGCEHAD